jgi:hypothetical protein
MMPKPTGRAKRRRSCGWLVAVSALALATLGVGPARGEVPAGRRPSWFRLIRGGMEDESAVVQELRRRLAEKDREIAALQDELARERASRGAVVPASAPPIPPPPTVPPTVRDDSAPDPASLSARPDSRWFDNLDLFLGLDGSKQPQDFGVNAHFGGRFAVNFGFPLIEELGLGGQVGTALNQTHNAVQVFERLGESTDRFQVFTTLGLFQRTSLGLNWAIAYDFLDQQYFDRFDLGQWRGRFGYELGPNDEVGIRVALSGRRDGGFFNKVPVTLDPITQGTIFWQHIFPSRAKTTFWAGLAEGHSQANIALGDTAPIRVPFVFGAELDIPLNDHLSLFGQANFIRPADTGTVDAFLGFSFHPSAIAQRARSARFAPGLPVAGNPTFSVDLTRAGRR